MILKQIFLRPRFVPSGSALSQQTAEERRKSLLVHLKNADGNLADFVRRVWEAQVLSDGYCPCVLPKMDLHAWGVVLSEARDVKEAIGAAGLRLFVGELVSGFLVEQGLLDVESTVKDVLFCTVTVAHQHYDLRPRPPGFAVQDRNKEVSEPTLNGPHFPSGRILLPVQAPATPPNTPNKKAATGRENIDPNRSMEHLPGRTKLPRIVASSSRSPKIA
ncbi:hypothetical protein C8R43DRAFT_1111620 [Mycena crocata]|nr:hypothetical protein C8R43DRAFT_1111620 [Mycena crocata]